MSSPLDASVVDVLKPAITQILKDADLSSISAKRVRGQLAQLPPGTLPASLDLSASKKQVDEVIRDCFDEISKSMPAPPKAASSRNGDTSAPPSGGLALPGLGGVRGSHTSTSSASPAPTKAGSAKTLNNNNNSSSSSNVKGKPEAKPKKKSAKKRAASDDGEDEPKKKRASNPNNPFNRPLVLSPLMAEVCGGPEMPRHAVVKQLWAYIKGNNLQNESNKRQILCDDKLTKIFGKDAVDSFEMAKLIGTHLSKKEESTPVPSEA